MNRHIGALAAVAAALVSGCMADPGGTETGNVSDAPEVTAPGPATPEGLATQLATAGVLGASSAPVAAAPLYETAREYIARHADRGPVVATDSQGVGAIGACAVCHGPGGGGDPELDAPRIGGLPEWYIARELKYFKSSVRAATDADKHGSQMRAIALLIDNSSIESLAGYLATLDPPAAPALGRGNPDHGRELYAACSACHGPGAEGNADLNAPSLLEQDGEYLVRQLEHFKSGVRGANPLDMFGQQMRPIAVATLRDPGDAADVVAYIGTLRHQQTASGG